MRTIVRNGLAVVLVGSLSLFAACTKSRQKVKMPEIKMITPENVHGVIAPDDRNIWLTGDYGIIFHSSDAGATWAAQDSGIKNSVLCDGVFIDSKQGWVVGINGIVLHTKDGGTTWTRQQTNTPRHLFGISFVDATHGWAVGEWSTIIYTTDGGATWSRQGEESDKIYKNVTFVDRETGWIVGEKGTILHTVDGGTTWQVQMPKMFERVSYEDELARPRPSLYSVCFVDKQNGWASGIDGMILRTSDGGASWQQLQSNTDLALYTIVIRFGRGWAVGDKGAYLMSADGGQTWLVSKNVIKSKFPFRDIAFNSPQQGWIVGLGGTVIHTTDGGLTWEFRSGLSYAMEFFQMPKALEFGGGTE